MSVSAVPNAVIVSTAILFAASEAGAAPPTNFHEGKVNVRNEESPMIFNVIERPLGCSW